MTLVNLGTFDFRHLRYGHKTRAQVTFLGEAGCLALVL